jgi:hypothetical protein
MCVRPSSLTVCFWYEFRMCFKVEEVKARIRLQHRGKMNVFTWLATIFRNQCKGKGRPVTCYEGPEVE